jgi:hypothetical protein
MPIIRTTKELRERDPHDFYPTPEGLILAIYKKELNNYIPYTAFDPGMGNGVWGKCLFQFSQNKHHIDGIDIRSDATNPLYANCDVSDFLTDDFKPRVPHYPLIIGNPPYKFAETFVRKSYDMLSDDGKMIFLLRLGFLASQVRGRGLWQTHKPRRIYVCSRRPSFTGNTKTDATEYAVYVWEKNCMVNPTLHWMDWEYTENDLGESKCMDM